MYLIAPFVRPPPAPPETWPGFRGGIVISTAHAIGLFLGAQLMPTIRHLNQCTTIGARVGKGCPSVITNPCPPPFRVARVDELMATSNGTPGPGLTTVVLFSRI